MKRIISLLVVLMMVISMMPAVHASTAPAVSDNIDDHFYINTLRWTDPIKSTLAAEDGGYMRVEYIDDVIVVEHYDAELNFVSGQEITPELPVYGGVYICEDYNFVLTGQNNPDEDDSQEVIRVTRYTKDWVKVDHASLFGANTVVPFASGCPRFDRSGDILYIRTSHEMYADGNGTNHQANIMMSVRISDMTVTDSLTKVWNNGYGYVSHSFNQFVRVDGDTLLAVDHGDAHPRSVCLFKYPYSAGSETFYGKTTMVNALNIVDSTYHYNDTGVSVGGFEYSSTYYLIAGCSYDQIESADLMYVHRNIFVTATPKDDFTDDATEIHWLTDYTAEDNVTVSPPHMVKLSDDRFILTWTENGSFKYCFVNAAGQLDGEIQSGTADLSDCVPILDGDRILWYVTDNSAPVFYQVSLSGGGVSIPHICEYSYSVQTAPTEQSEGLLQGLCGICSQTRDITLPVLSETDYDRLVITKPGHETTGLARYTWKITTYGTYSFEVILPACSHNYTAVVTSPTCTEGGSTAYTCADCGHSYVGDYTDALGHSYGDWVVTQAPGCKSAGERTHTCTACGHTETEVMSATGHSYESVVTAPTCTEQGYTTHTCRNCGDTYTDSYTPAAGHSYGDWTVTQAPTCTVPGIETKTCASCGSTEQQTVAALGHAYQSAVTEPTCTEQGYTTHTCTRCQDSYKDSYVSALGHAWDEGVVIQEPTETDSGLRRHTCTACGATSDRVIPPLSHEHSYESIVTEPTCTEGGFTTHTCECGDSYVDTYTAALGHSEVVDKGYAATCTETGLTDGAHCGRCNVVLRQREEIPATGHHYEAAVTSPTCEAEGYTLHTCTGCRDSYRDAFIPALGHDWHGLDCLRCDATRENPFTDTNPYSYYFEPLLWAVENNITNGVTETTFAPENPCTRAQVVTFLWRSQGCPEPKSSSCAFTDIEKTGFYYKAVLWAVENGITTGTTGTTFAPNGPCTRSQVVTFLWRSQGCPKSSARNPFTDVKSGTFYYNAVLWAVENNVTNGVSEQVFGIQSTCKRSQIVTFLYRTFVQ